MGVVQSVKSDGLVGINIGNQVYLERFTEDLVPAEYPDYLKGDSEKGRGGQGPLQQEMDKYNKGPLSKE